MSITLTTPETRPSVTTVNLVSRNINDALEYAELRFEKGFLDNSEFVKTDERTLRFQNGDGGVGKSNIADFSWNQLVNFTINAAKFKDIAPVLEQAAIDLGVFDGTAD